MELDIGSALQTAYERAHYDLRIDYWAPCDPPLATTDTEWAADIIRQAAEAA
jgi:hypothetical protein